MRLRDDVVVVEEQVGLFSKTSELRSARIFLDGKPLLERSSE
jgi:hypothetical protein